jgi:UDP-N-acetylglucosamine/UDP-N-acetylgalactosamine diphosphorylase
MVLITHPSTFPSSLSSLVPDKLRATYEGAGQGHVFRFVDAGVGGPEAARFLLKQLETIDPVKLGRDFRAAKAVEEQGGVSSAGAPLEPAAPPKGSDAPATQREAWLAAGHDAIRRGSVAAVILGGGQGTRLGYDGPKGTYDLGLPSGKTLFQLVAERLRCVARLAGAENPPRLYVMTSSINHDQTVAYFGAHTNFGLPKDGVRFFPQGVLPCVSEEGLILLQDAGSVAVAPDGNGGLYRALSSTGMLGDMKSTGVTHIHVFSIDNALTRPVDPLFVGYCLLAGVAVGNKSVWKASAEEKVGVLAQRAGRTCVVEYSELTPELRDLAGEDGKLLFGAGNICNHFLSLDFIETVVLKDGGSLPYHLARKKIPVASERDGSGGAPPDCPNGLKLETFVFDVFPMADGVAVFEAQRQDEFAPVKNAPGSCSDSPDTARAMLSAQARRWLEGVGATIKGEGPIEICPLLSFAGEGLGSFSGRIIEARSGQGTFLDK